MVQTHEKRPLAMPVDGLTLKSMMGGVTNRTKTNLT